MKKGQAGIVPVLCLAVMSLGLSFGIMIGKHAGKEDLSRDLISGKCQQLGREIQCRTVEIVEYK